MQKKEEFWKLETNSFKIIERRVLFVDTAKVSYLVS